MVSLRARRAIVASVSAISIGIMACLPAGAETLTGALAKAYENNPPLNALRAAQRALDENVAIAKSGNRPNITASGSYGTFSRDGESGGPNVVGRIELQQNLFNGFQTRNAVRSARAGVFSGREELRGGEQDTLLAAVQAYVAVIRDRRIVQFRRQNISFLDEQLNASQARFEVGEGTRTDVAQARAERAAAVADLETARANVQSSEATYIRVIGSAPSNLNTPRPASALLPHGLEQAVAIAIETHPDVRRARFDVEQTAFNVKQAEGQFLPSLDLAASVERARQDAVLGGRVDVDSTALSARLTVPIYQGGRASAQVRQAKEQLSQSRILVDSARRDARARVVQAFADYQAALAARTSTNAQIRAARLAVEGLVEERNVGQRTTLDVLLGQQTLINAQILAAQNDALLVSTSYALVAAVGRLTARDLGLPVTVFEPDDHFLAVKDKWYGLRTPDQR